MTEQHEEHDVESESESESDSDMEIEESKIKDLEEKVAARPAMEYKAHKELVELLRTAGELLRVRTARERFSTYFPLTEQFWLEWIQDEEKLAMNKSAKLKVLELFDKACEDYFSVTLYTKRIEFAQQVYGEQDIPELRKVFERSILLGSHYSKGAEFWDKYIDFETRAGGQDAPQTVEVIKMGIMACVLFPSRSNLVQRVSLTAEEQADFEKVDQFVSQCNELTLDESESAHKIGTGRGDPKVWLEYISNVATLGKKVNTKSMEEAICCLYERAISTCCLRAHLWEEYLYYQQFVICDDVKALGTAKRATRNCPSESGLWCTILLITERQATDFASLVHQVNTILSQAVSSSFPSPDGYVNVLLVSCDIFRRGWLLEKSDTEKIKHVTEQFQYAIRFLKSYFPQYAPGNLKLVGSYTEWLEETGSSVEACYEVWTSFIESTAENIQTYRSAAKYFARMKHMELSRKIIKQGMHVFKRGGASGKGAKELGLCWLDLEARHGTKESLFECLRSTGPKPGAVGGIKQKRKRDVGGGNDKKRVQIENTSKRAVGGPNDKKRARVETSNQQEDSDKKKAKLGESSSEQAAKGESKCDATKTTQLASRQEQQEQKLQSINERSVFVVNFSYKSTPEEIKEHFSQCGSVLHVHLKTTKTGQSRGFGTIEFETPESVKKALEELNGSTLSGRVIEVTEIKKNKTKKDQLKSRVTGHDLDLTVYIGRLPANVCNTSEYFMNGDSALAISLRKCGSIEDVTVARNRASVVVRFETAEAAKAALELNNVEFSSWGEGEKDLSKKIIVERVKSRYVDEAKHSKKRSKQIDGPTKRLGGGNEPRRRRGKLDTRSEPTKKPTTKQAPTVDSGMKSNDFF
mmetsp:Transcript_18052/g.30742  ORF Transcript_18052/g.30742 Transcript_18052/m.30742 type:complete len:866 (+) Transcript_18052:143-2740(+)